jgi:hypothetical protein
MIWYGMVQYSMACVIFYVPYHSIAYHTIRSIPYHIPYIPYHIFHTKYHDIPCLVICGLYTIRGFQILDDMDWTSHV